MPVTTAELRERIARLPAISLATLPTPLEHCARLSVALGGPEILVKRDDLTGLALGGNKTRQLDLIIGRALAEGADALVTAAGVQSNQCRQTAAAGARLGLPVRLVLRGPRPQGLPGNLVTDYLLTDHITFVPAEASNAEVTAVVQQQMDEQRAAGLRPYFVDLINEWSHDNVLAALSYMRMVAELVDQLAGRAPDWIYLNCGSEGSGTMGGIVAGCRALGLSTRVMGIPAAPVADSVRADTLAIAREALQELGFGQEAAVSLEDIQTAPSFAGPGYGQITDEGLEAIRLAARTEGLILEPIYTGKALAALIAHCRAGRFDPQQRVVFLHTGGAPLVFLPELAARLARLC